MNKVLLVMLLAPVLGWGQTVALEAAYLNKQISEKKWTSEESSSISKAWSQIKGQYPKFPYDSVEKKIWIENVIEFPGTTKATAFKRVKEWGALHFGKLETVLEYEDIETGKIILEGFSEISHLTKGITTWFQNKPIPTTSNLYFSLVITLKDGKAKVHYENLEFRHWRDGYSLGSYYVPGEWERSTFHTYFPITARPSDTWVVTLDLMRKSLIELQATAPSLERYIKAAGDDYRF